MRRTPKLLAGLAGTLLALAVTAPVAHAAPTHALTPRQPSADSVVYRDSAVIEARPGQVWDVLVDFPRYEAWNPWIVRAEGEARPGATVHVDVMLGEQRTKAEHTVLVVQPERRFCWKDAGWNAWFVYGQRCRTLTPQPDGSVLFEVELLLDGPLSGVADHFQGEAMRTGMAAETAALKQRAEQAA